MTLHKIKSLVPTSFADAVGVLFAAERMAVLVDAVDGDGEGRRRAPEDLLADVVVGALDAPHERRRPQQRAVLAVEELHVRQRADVREHDDRVAVAWKNVIVEQLKNLKCK